jgi:hypothetical protein
LGRGKEIDTYDVKEEIDTYAPQALFDEKFDAYGVKNKIDTYETNIFNSPKNRRNAFGFDSVNLRIVF